MIVEELFEAFRGLDEALAGAPALVVAEPLVPMFERLFDRMGEKREVVGRPSPAFDSSAWSAPEPGALAVGFTGGKDSLAVLLKEKAAGGDPRPFFVSAINKGYTKEEERAAELARALGLVPLMRKGIVPQKPAGFAEHPFKNQFILAAMIESEGPLGVRRFALGNYRRERVWHEDPRAGFSDALEVFQDFQGALAAWGVPATIETPLLDELDAWNEIRSRAPHLLGRVESCIIPNYRRPNIRKANEKKFGEHVLLPGRCGSCYKCAEEYLYHAHFGLLPRSEAYAARCLEIEREFREKNNLYPIFAGGSRDYHPTTETQPMHDPVPAQAAARPASPVIDLSTLDYAATPIAIKCTGADRLPLDALEEFQGGLKRRTARDLDNIIISILRYGFSFPFFVWNGTGHNYVLDGHGRISALAEFRRRGGVLPLFPVIHVEAEDEAEAKNKLLRLNSQYGTMTAESVMEFAQGIEVDWGELRLMGGEIDMGEAPEPMDGEAAVRSLASRFGVPPFSILDSRQGYWQERRRAWLELGIRSEVGRGENLLKMSDAALTGYAKRSMGVYQPGAGGAIRSGSSGYTGTSIFDPVLCELVYRWFSPKAGARVLDPFAGGSVRGVVAAKLGRSYVGIELRAEQVAENQAQAVEVLPPGLPAPAWINGNSCFLPALLEGAGQEEAFDLVFSCPPYHDLEVYSDDPEDLSNLPWEEFVVRYRGIIEAAVSRLKENRFAVFVVSEIRNKAGTYKGFVPETIRAFEDAGARFYNEAILVNSAGSLPLRAGRIFQAARKLGRCHQNVLVFFKGDPDRVSQEFEEVDIPEDAFGAESAADVEDSGLPE